MSEHTSTYDTTGYIDGSISGLSPPMRAVVTDALPARDRSLPVALCRLAGETGARAHCGADPGYSTPALGQTLEQTLEPMTNAVASFEGYVRLRLDLLQTDRYERATDRDAAILASDHLHATAYTMVAEVPGPDRRTLELYRVLTEYSSVLAHQLVAGIEPTRTAGTASDRPQPMATLAGTAAELGATAVGAPAEIRTAMQTYGRSLSAALAASSPTDCRPWETAVAVLAGRAPSESERGAEDEDRDQHQHQYQYRCQTNDEHEHERTRQHEFTYREAHSHSQTGSRDHPRSIPAETVETVDEHLERARTALDEIADAIDGELAVDADSGVGGGTDADADADVDADRRSSAGTRPDSSESRSQSQSQSHSQPRPLARLERATQIPFENVLEREDDA